MKFFLILILSILNLIKIFPDGEALSGLKEIGEFGKAMTVGMVSMWKSEKSTSYNFKVINDSDEPVIIKSFIIKNLMGADVGTKLELEKICQPNSSTDSAFANEKAPLMIKIYDTKNKLIFKKKIAFGSTDQKSTPQNLYHIYKDDSGLCAESLGTGKGSSNDFIAMISNKINIKKNIMFDFGKETFIIELDPLSFASLKSTDTNKIRPKDSSKKKYLAIDSGSKADISSNGIGSITGDSSKDPNSKEPSTEQVNVMRYNYIIYSINNDSIIRQAGLAIGNFQQPNSKRIRNITPIECNIWVKKAEDSGSDQMVSIEDPKQSVWVSYFVPGWRVKSNKTENGLIVKKIPYGKCLNFFIVRPQIDYKSHENREEQLNSKQSKAPLCIATVETTDDQKAFKFMKKLAKRELKIKRALISVDSEIFKTDPTTSMANSLITGESKIIDPETGVSGFVIICDEITQWGTDSGPFYYSISTPSFFLGNFLNLISSYIQNIDEKTLNAQVNLWLMAYRQSKDESSKSAIKNEIIIFLQQNGIDKLFESKNGILNKSTFNHKGKLAKNMLLNSAMSLENIPTLRSIGSTDPLSRSKPKKWADSADVISL